MVLMMRMMVKMMTARQESLLIIFLHAHQTQSCLNKDDGDDGDDDEDDDGDDDDGDDDDGDDDAGCKDEEKCGRQSIPVRRLLCSHFSYNQPFLKPAD